MKPRILLLSAYDTPSHRAWCRGLQQHLDDFEWTYLSLPARYFAWRIRGNPLSWWASEAAMLRQDYDVLLATSMVDVATLCGLFPNLGRCRKLVYFHENQFAYPASDKQKSRLEPQMVNLYSALAADGVLFNSAYNRDSFLAGVRALLQKLPDYSPPEIADALAEKSQLLPVPIVAHEYPTETRIPRSLVWNHRWEYDKNPEDFFQACDLLKKAGADFKLIVMGQQFRQQPEIFAQARQDFAAQILCWGEQSAADYRRWLARGEWVVSTALHEFQGLAVMEAVQAGCLPAVPNRLSYPQWFAEDDRYGQSAEDLAAFLLAAWGNTDLPPAPDMQGMQWTTLAEDYRAIFN